jgi:CTP-dependent riboflavin kinase
MVAVANMQEDRIQKLWEKERDLGGMVMPGLDKVVDSYISILREIQKMQFDLGVDEYKGTLTLSRSVMETSRSPEGHIVQRNVVEAMEFAQKTFKLRGVYPPVLEAAK